MKNNVPEDAILGILNGLITGLPMIVAQMEQVIQPPALLDAGTDKQRFRYENPDALTLEVLKCVRIASALRAAFTLLVNGHTIEVGVMFRTIDDACGDFFFVDEVIDTGKANAAQAKYLAEYFGDEKSINDNERRRKVQAAEARYLGQGNPSDAKQTVKTIDNTFSGIIHGSYSAMMDMYGGKPARFHVEGMPVRSIEYRVHLGIYIHRALNVFCKVANNLGQHELAETIRDLRQIFEKNPSYTQHLGSSGGAKGK